MNRPHTAEGQAAWRACEREGVWRRSGMSGMLSGLELDQALATTDVFGFPRTPALIDAMTAIERGAMAGAVKAAKRPRGPSDD